LICMAAAGAKPPAAPQVTFGASGIKQLRFDWDILPRSNYYELWFKANNNAPEVKFSEQVPWRPVALTAVSAHLLDWDQVRYRVRACNPSGCGSSPLISVKSVLPDTVGVLKTPVARDDSLFGTVVDIAEDGQTLIAGSNEADDPDNLPAINYAYVYRRHNAAWQLEARLAPTGNSNENFASLAVSADGSRFVAGFPEVRTGHDEVVIWHRTATGWVQEGHITMVLARQGYLGELVDIDAAGETVLLARTLGSGILDIYRRTGTSWNYLQTIDAPAGPAGCNRAGVSGNGRTIARECFLTPESGPAALAVEVFAAPDWTRRNLIQIAGAASFGFGGFALDQTGNTIAAAFRLPQDDAAASPPQVAVFQRDTSEYTRRGTLSPGSWSNKSGSTFGGSVALARDGGFAAIGDVTDDASGAGVFSPPLSAGTAVRGAVYVFERHGSAWITRRVVKPKVESSPSPYSPWNFGDTLSLGDNGKTLVVGQPNESTAGRDAGAVWIY